MGMPDEATQTWLAEMWPFVQDHLPPAPARVLEIGCGAFGGFVPRLRRGGFLAAGVDPEAPQGSWYHRTTFEQLESSEPLDAIVACTALHHVDDLSDVLDRVAQALRLAGTLIVVEWAYEKFDYATARWCFDHLAPQDHDGWLRRHRDRWDASTRSWDSCLASWAAEEHLHAGRDIERALLQRFETSLMTYGHYFFSDLDGMTGADEQAAIDSGKIQATGIYFVGTRR